jgi:hypothetical protein
MQSGQMECDNSALECSWTNVSNLCLGRVSALTCPLQILAKLGKKTLMPFGGNGTDCSKEAGHCLISAAE